MNIYIYIKILCISRTIEKEESIDDDFELEDGIKTVGQDALRI